MSKAKLIWDQVEVFEDIDPEGDFHYRIIGHRSDGKFCVGFFYLSAINLARKNAEDLAGCIRSAREDFDKQLEAA